MDESWIISHSQRLHREALTHWSTRQRGNRSTSPIWRATRSAHAGPAGGAASISSTPGAGAKTWDLDLGGQRHRFSPRIFRWFFYVFFMGFYDDFMMTLWWLLLSLFAVVVLLPLSCRCSRLSCWLCCCSCFLWPTASLHPHAASFHLDKLCCGQPHCEWQMICRCCLQGSSARGKAQ